MNRLNWTDLMKSEALLAHHTSFDGHLYSISSPENERYSYASNVIASGFDSNPKTRNSMDETNVSWNGLFQLLSLSLISTFGSMGGIFLISAITVIDTFQVRGNVFLVSLSMSHLMITILVIPSSCVAIMANIPNDPSICHFQWLTTLSCLMISVLSFMFMSIENFYGLNALVTYDLCCTKFRIIFIVFIIWIFGLCFPIGQHINNYGPSFCPHELNKPIMLPYHASIGGLILIFPSLVTIFYFTRSALRIKVLKVQLENNPTEDPWACILTDESLLKSNIVVYIIYFLMWSPLCVVAAISTFKPMTQNLLNTCWYLGLSNSCAYSFIYAATNKEFAEAFFKLFYYCCCKSHVTFARKGGGPRRGLANDPMSLRVHIIPGLNIYAQRRDCTSTVPTRVTGGHNYNTHLSHGGGHYIGGATCSSGPFAKTFQNRNYKTTIDL